MKQRSSQDVQGEGNYTAARRYDDATQKFVNSGKVNTAAQNAAPKSAKEANEMRAAEAAGKSHAKGIQGGEPDMDMTAPPKKAPPKNRPIPKKVQGR